MQRRFQAVASGLREQILPVSYDKIHSHTMMPFAHLAWSSAWAGIAAAAVERARAFVRKATHRAGGTLPPGAAHLTRAGATLRTLRSLIAAALQRFEAAASDPAMLESIDFQTGMNMLKVNASEFAVATVMSAMQACGLSGYRNDSEFSIGRHLRDILSSPIMISNDRSWPMSDEHPARQRRRHRCATDDRAVHKTIAKVAKTKSRRR